MQHMRCSTRGRRRARAAKGGRGAQPMPNPPPEPGRVSDSQCAAVVRVARWHKRPPSGSVCSDSTVLASAAAAATGPRRSRARVLTEYLMTCPWPRGGLAARRAPPRPLQPDMQLSGASRDCWGHQHLFRDGLRFHWCHQLVQCARRLYCLQSTLRSSSPALRDAELHGRPVHVEVDELELGSRERSWPCECVRPLPRGASTDE
jgi:hypothetical protein